MGSDWVKYSKKDAPTVKLREFKLDPLVVNLVPEELALKYKVIAINTAGSSLIVAFPFPADDRAVFEIEFHTGYKVEYVYASEGDIMEAINRYYD